MKELEISFLHLVRLGIGHILTLTGSAANTESMDWVAMKDLAEKQGLSAIVLDGLDKANTKITNRPPQSLMLEWIGEVMQNYEARYKQYERVIGELAGLYNSHGYKMMVLKGYACSLNWPKPSHRPCGDIDIWQFGKQKEADETLRHAQGPGFKIDDSHEHHTVFYWRDFMVENHYDFIDVHHRKSSPKLEKIFKELGKDDSHFVEVKSASSGSATKVYLPSPNLHALFLLRHSMEHFASTELTLRQLLDWAFFVEKHGKDVDWEWLESVLDEFGMTPAYNIFNAICVEDLGFESEILPKVQFDPFLKERVLNDILNPEFSEESPKGFIPRISYKYRRWKANGWKNELCFKESLWSAFWSGVWGKILKPSQI